MKGSGPVKTGPLVSALPIFPGRHQPSIFGASELNCRVRDGNGWTLTAISTDCAQRSRASILTAFAAKINSRDPPSGGTGFRPARAVALPPPQDI